MKSGIAWGPNLYQPDGQVIAGSPIDYLGVNVKDSVVAFTADGLYYLTLTYAFRTDTWGAFSYSPLNSNLGAKSVACSPDNRFIAFARDNSPYITVINRQNPNPANWTTVTIQAPVNVGIGVDVKFSPNSQWMALAHTGGAGLTVWETTNWTRLTIESLSGGYSISPTRLAFSPNNAYLAVTSYLPVIAVYNTSNWTRIDIPQVFHPSNGGGGLCCAFSADNQYLVNGRDNFVLVYSTSDWENYQIIHLTVNYFDQGFYPIPNDVLFSRDGLTMWMAYYYPIWEIRDDELVKIERTRLAGWTLTPGSFPGYNGEDEVDANIEIIVNQIVSRGLAESPDVFYEVSGTITSANSDFRLWVLRRSDGKLIGSYNVSNTYSALLLKNDEVSVVCMDRTDTTLPNLILGKIIPG